MHTAAVLNVDSFDMAVLMVFLRKVTYSMYPLSSPAVWAATIAHSLVEADI
jgi:hypothetical protein